MKNIKCSFKEGDIEPVYVQLGRRLAMGRNPGSPDVTRADSADVALLDTEQTAIAMVDGNQCQVMINRWNDDYIIEDKNPQAFACQLNGKLFTRSKLVINDRLSLGEGFHFHFDGCGLTRVPERQGGRIEAQNISKIYQPGPWSVGKAPAVALRNASIIVEPNEFVGVLGPSGGGKSTLIKMLSGTFAPTKGKVTINGVDVNRYPELIRSVVGVVPQDDIVHPELTVWDAVFTSACLRLPKGIIKEAKRLLVETSLARLRLWEFRHRRVRELSGGQRKRVSIAIEILKKSSVLFLDEPSSGLDPNKEEELMIQLRELAEQGITVICTTHVLDRDFLFNKVCIVVKGDVVFFGPTEEAPGFFGERSLLDVYRLLDSPSYIPVPWGHWGPKVDWSSGAQLPSRNEGVDVVVKELTQQVAEHSDQDGMKLLRFERGGVVLLPDSIEEADVTDLLRLAREGSGSLVLDLSKLAREHSAGPLEELTTVHTALSRRGSSLSLVNPPEFLLDVFRVHRCMERLRVFESLEVAVRDGHLGDSLLEGEKAFSWDWQYKILAALALLMVGGLAWLVWQRFFH